MLMNKASKNASTHTFRYLPQKPLLLNSSKNKLNSQNEKDINKKDYNTIKEMLETKQEIIYKNVSENKDKKILPPEDKNKNKNKNKRY